MMVNVPIPEELDAGLEQAANRDGRSKYDLLYEVIACHLEEDHAGKFHLSEQQMERMKLSIAQADRGEVILAETVLAKLDAVIAELEISLIRVVLTSEASQDLDGLTEYIRSLPKSPGVSLGTDLQRAIRLIGSYPSLGPLDPELSSVFCSSHSSPSLPRLRVLLHGERSTG